MAGFPTYIFARREAAIAHQPIVDPAGWLPNDLRNLDNWSYELTPSNVTEIKTAISFFRKYGAPIQSVTPKVFPLQHLSATLHHIRMELKTGLGCVRLTGFPVDQLECADAMIAYLGIGSHIGTLEPQNRLGHLVGHVKNYQDARTDAVGRGYNTNVSSSFHVDSTDYATLLCVNESRSGGESRLASSVTVYNRILAERPDLIAILMRDYYKTRYGEEREGETPYYKSPVFAFTDGYFSCTGLSKTFFKAEELPGVPPYSEDQKASLPVFERIVEECSIDIPFRRGDIILVNNHVTLHARRGFEEWPDTARRRHLWRLWLNDVDPRPIHPDRMERRNRGEHLADVARKVPLDLDEPVI